MPGAAGPGLGCPLPAPVPGSGPRLRGASAACKRRDLSVPRSLPQGGRRAGRSGYPSPVGTGLSRSAGDRGRPGAVFTDRPFSTDLGISVPAVSFVNCRMIAFPRALSAQLYVMKFGLVLSFQS